MVARYFKDACRLVTQHHQFHTARDGSTEEPFTLIYTAMVPISIRTPYSYHGHLADPFMTNETKSHMSRSYEGLGQLRELKGGWEGRALGIWGG